ncbi:MAG: hypothetical protein V1821_01365 [bacterium]
MMRLVIGEHQGKRVVLIVGAQAEERLARTCFRPLSEPRAGNFQRFRSAREIIARRGIIQKLQEECLGELRELQGDESRFSFSLQDLGFVGWSSTAPREGFLAEQLEPLELNWRATALRVKKDLELLAPPTREITFVVNLKMTPREVILFVFSIYPGPDVGELVGDVSLREGVVFFDWNHPGKPF